MIGELLDDTVYRLSLGMVNAYLVDDGEVTLVDTGTPRAFDDLKAGLEQAGYGLEDLDRVLVTHFDLDHVGGLADLGPDIEIVAADPDASFIDGTKKPPLSNHKGILQRAMGWFMSRPHREIDRVADGERIGGFTAYHTPGHTPGHVIFLHESFEVALLGDLVTGTNGGLGTPSWFLAYSASQNARSIQQLADRIPAFEIAAMGHGSPLSQGGSAALDALAESLE